VHRWLDCVFGAGDLQKLWIKLDEGMLDRRVLVVAFPAGIL
jgi:hypothetical protein